MRSTTKRIPVTCSPFIRPQFNQGSKHTAVHLFARPDPLARQSALRILLVRLHTLTGRPVSTPADIELAGRFPTPNLLGPGHARP
ncbi:MAG: hypothetical protein RMN51_02505 [Verrucomicrobiota bacterium]|nr:hypothetical protein [Limisphaera sp.]MDW8380968.1 hypothetical protein [Verrucomicrobiota bacterium]